MLIDIGQGVRAAWSSTGRDPSDAARGCAGPSRWRSSRSSVTVVIRMVGAMATTSVSPMVCTAALLWSAAGYARRWAGRG